MRGCRPCSNFWSIAALCDLARERRSPATCEFYSAVPPPRQRFVAGESRSQRTTAFVDRPAVNRHPPWARSRRAEPRVGFYPLAVRALLLPQARASSVASRARRSGGRGPARSLGLASSGPARRDIVFWKNKILEKRKGRDRLKNRISAAGAVRRSRFDKAGSGRAKLTGVGNRGKFPGGLVDAGVDRVASAWKRQARRGAYAPAALNARGYRKAPPGLSPLLPGAARRRPVVSRSCVLEEHGPVRA